MRQRIFKLRLFFIDANVFFSSLLYILGGKALIILRFSELQYARTIKGLGAAVQRVLVIKKPVIIPH